MTVKEGRNPGRGRMEWEGEVKGKDRDCLLLGGCAIIVNQNDDDYSTGRPQRYSSIMDRDRARPLPLPNHHAILRLELLPALTLTSSPVSIPHWSPFLQHTHLPSILASAHGTPRHFPMRSNTNLLTGHFPILTCLEHYHIRSPP